jgi:hypothetical protein
MMSGRDLEGSGSFRSGVLLCMCSSLAKLGPDSPKMRCRYTSPLQCGMCALTAKPECVSATPALCSAKCVHLQRNPNAFPLHQPCVVRNVCIYSKPECVSATPALCSAECVHLQQNPNAFPLHQPSVVRNVCTYSKIRVCCRHTSVILSYV